MRRNRVGTVLHQPAQPRRPRAAAVDPTPAPHASLIALLARAFRSLARHAGLYLLGGAVVVAAEAAIVFNWHSNTALIVSGALVQPFFVAIVNAFSYADVRGEGAAWAWLRVLERSWAVLLVDLVFALVAGIAILSIAGTDLLQKVLGTAVALVAVSMVFADVHATVADDAEPWWLLVPRSFGASMAVVWQGASFARALILFALSVLLPTATADLVQGALDARHIAQAAFWADALPEVLLLPVVQAFCTFVYLDAIGYEPSDPCRE